MKTQQEIEDEIVEASIMNAGNFGAPVDMFHPEYGQILKDSKPTPEGLEFFAEQLEPFLLSTKVTGKA